LSHFATPEFWFHYRRLPAETRELADRCGTSLVSVGDRLNAESQSEDNQRRGIESYHATLTR